MIWISPRIWSIGIFKNKLQDATYNKLNDYIIIYNSLQLKITQEWDLGNITYYDDNTPILFIDTNWKETTDKVENGINIIKMVR